MLKFHVPFSTWSYSMTSKMNKKFTRIIWWTTWQLEKWVLASEPRKWACCAKSYMKFNMRIMHKLGCYMVSQIPLSKTSSCHYFQFPPQWCGAFIKLAKVRKDKWRTYHGRLSIFPMDTIANTKIKFCNVGNPRDPLPFLTIWVWLFSMLLDVLNNLIST
jgi:hypothetical protein